MYLQSDSFQNNQQIPGEFAFGVPATEGHVTLSDNRSPHLSWTGAPEGTRSFAILCHDPDVPSVGDDVNREGRTVSQDLPRVDFYHWVLVNIPHHVQSMAAGADSDGVTAGGKPTGPCASGTRGVNNYTDWFAGDPDMGGDYGGYDGPCPPWNDEILHHYHFTVYALDTESLNLPSRFGGPEVLAAMEGHILGKATLVGTYTLNPALEG